MRIEMLGETTLILHDLDCSPADAARQIRNAHIPGIVDVVPAFRSVGVYGNDELPDPGLLENALRSTERTQPGRSHTIPVCYEHGDDLTEVAAWLGCATEKIVALHTDRPFECRAIGFCPGFPYLGPLPRELCGLPRRATPRLHVRAGAVAITGDQTGIYTQDRPGGWQIIGYCPLTLVDVADDYFPIESGDRVQFFAIPHQDFVALEGERL